MSWLIGVFRSNRWWENLLVLVVAVAVLMLCLTGLLLIIGRDMLADAKTAAWLQFLSATVVGVAAVYVPWRINCAAVRRAEVEKFAGDCRLLEAIRCELDTLWQHYGASVGRELQRNAEGPFMHYWPGRSGLLRLYAGSIDRLSQIEDIDLKSHIITAAAAFDALSDVLISNNRGLGNLDEANRLTAQKVRGARDYRQHEEEQLGRSSKRVRSAFEYADKTVPRTVRLIEERVKAARSKGRFIATRSGRDTDMAAQLE